MPFRGSAAVFALGALLFLFVTLGIGVLISTVSQNQGQAIQLAVMTMLPQILLSGLIFPLSSIAAGVRWIAYLLPLTYFNEISRGVMLRAEPIGPLWQPFTFLAVLGLVVVTLAILRFRRFLAPAPVRHRRGSEDSTRERERAAHEQRVGRDRGSAWRSTGRSRSTTSRWPRRPARSPRSWAATAPGKTTLLRCLAGALAPEAGAVTGPGRKAIGYLPASSGTYPDLTVAENLAFRAAAYRLRGAARRGGPTSWSSGPA